MFISDYSKEFATGFYKILVFRKQEQGYDNQLYSLELGSETSTFKEIGNAVENGHVIILLPVKGLE